MVISDNPLLIDPVASQIIDPATYTGEILAGSIDIVQDSTYHYAPVFDEYKFHTPYFDAIRADFFWTNIAHQSYKLSVQANLHFNYPVDPGVVKDFLEVKRAESEVTDYRIITENNSEVIAIIFGEIEQTDKAQKFSIRIKED